jgi:MFS family permease
MMNVPDETAPRRRYLKFRLEKSVVTVYKLAMKWLSENGARTNGICFLLIGGFLLITSPTNFFLPVFFREDLGFTDSQIALLYSIQAVTGMLAAFPCGMGNDRVKSRDLIGVSLLVTAIGYVLMGTVRGFVPYLFVYFALTIAVSVFRLSLDIQMLKTDTGKDSGYRFGLYQAFRFGGLVIGTSVAGYILVKLHFSTTLIVIAALIFGLILISRLLPPTLIAHVRLSDYRADFSDPRVIFFAAWMGIFALHWGAEYTCYGLFLRHNLGLSLVGMGWYMSAEFAGILLTVLVAGRYADKPDKLKVLTILGLVTSGLGHVGMVIPTISISVLFRSIHGIGDGFIFIVFYVGILRLFALEHLGGNTGIINLMQMVGSIIGSVLSALAGEAFGYGYPLIVTGILTVLLIVPILSNRYRQLASMPRGAIS